MSMRYPAGFIRPGFDPLKNPDAPTGVSASGGDASASVSFTPPSNVGGSAVSAYYAVSNPGGITASGASSPVSVTGLTNGTAYTFAVWALNTYGPGPFSAASGSVSPAAPRGLFGGGFTTTQVNTIEFITISATGNATNFGDLTLSRTDLASCSSSTRGLFGGGYDDIGPNNRTNVIDYVTIASTGNAVDFGDLIQFRQGLAACSSSTIGLFFAGTYYSGSTQRVNIIEYVTIASTGDTTDFGDLLSSIVNPGGCSSPTRGICAGGHDGSDNINVIQYVTIATTGNSTDFGDLTAQTGYPSSSSSSTRGLFFGGATPGVANVISFITIATTGNATDFGDLLAANQFTASCSSQIRAVVGGGEPSANTNVIQYVTIASAGNATDFGDLTSATSGLAACSNGHGGLQ